MSTARTKLDEILAEAKRLPKEQRQQLVDSLQADKVSPPSESRRQQALQRWLARAGSGHANSSDISGRKYEYLGKT